jgi:hypothetical protein
MTLFDEKARTNLAPPAWHNSPFSYLDASGRPVAGRMRHLFEQAFRRMDPARTADLRSKFRSPRYDNHLGAAAEIILHEMFVRRGLSVEIGPSVAGGKTPDFRLMQDGIAGPLVEATTIGNGINQHLSSLFDTLERVDAPALRFNVRVKQEPKSQLRLGEVRKAVQAFANAASASLPLGSVQLAASPKLVLRGSDGLGLVEIRAQRRRTPGRGRNVGMSDISDSEFLAITELRRVIGHKASRYSNVQEPLVVAVAPNRSFIRRAEVLDALFGERFFDRPGRASDGVWRGPPNSQRTRLSGVLIFYGFKLWPSADTRIELIKNPWATYPVSGNPFGCDLTEAIDGKLAHSTAATLGDLLGLGENWPGDDQ